MLKTNLLLTFIIMISAGMTACSNTKPKKVITTQTKPFTTAKKQAKIIPVVYEKRSPKQWHQQIQSGSFANKLSSAALGRLRSRVRYDGSYVKIAYPWGDVPSNIGVCTDVVIRSYRKLGIDLQQQVHHDMSSSFNAYPNPRKWGLSQPDTNIDHRRVYNLRAFFARRGAALPITRNPGDYSPGDLVTWMVGKDLPHIGVVVNKRSKADPNRYMIVHNIAQGPQMEDILFRFPITGHYRYSPSNMGNIPKPIYASHNGSTRTNAMNYAQLVEAASLLNATPNKSVLRKIPTVSKSDKQSVQLAKLTNQEVQQLLAR